MHNDSESNMTVELIDTLLKKLKPTIDNYNSILNTFVTTNLINDYLVVENNDEYECYYQMDETDNSFYFTTVAK